MLAAGGDAVLLAHGGGMHALDWAVIGFASGTPIVAVIFAMIIGGRALAKVEPGDRDAPESDDHEIAQPNPEGD